MTFIYFIFFFSCILFEGKKTPQKSHQLELSFFCDSFWRRFQFRAPRGDPSQCNERRPQGGPAAAAAAGSLGPRSSHLGWHRGDVFAGRRPSTWKFRLRTKRQTDAQSAFCFVWRTPPFSLQPSLSLFLSSETMVTSGCSRGRHTSAHTHFRFMPCLLSRGNGMFQTLSGAPEKFEK